MATTRIWKVRDNLARVLDYAENHLKTANPNDYTQKELKDLRNALGYAASDNKTVLQHYVTGVNCIGEIAYEAMMTTKRRFGKTGGNLAYHSYQSFAPGEITPEVCHEIGVKLAQRIWGDRYEVLVTTHLDTTSLHNHFVINSVSFVDGKKFDNNFDMYFGKLRKQSDIICKEYGLSVIENPGKKKNRHMVAAQKRGELTSWCIMRADIDEAIQQSMTDTQFYRKLEQWGYSLNLSPHRKYPTIRAQGSNKATRFDTLGENYSRESIKTRILENRRPYYTTPNKVYRHNYRYKGVYINPNSVSIMIVYLILSMFLRRIRNLYRTPNNPQRTHYTPELREAIRRIDQYSQRTRFVCRYKIETPEQLQSLIHTKNKERYDLERERGKVYNKMRSAKTPEKIAELKVERNDLSEKIKAVRKELFIAGCVRKEFEEIKKKVLAQREYEARLLEAERIKERNKKGRSHER